MKRTIITMGILAVTLSAMAGGIVHNTNQSASFIRMPARDASLGIDAVYYNPAGLFKLNDGFHFSLNNQYITQTRYIESTFPYLKNKEYEGGVVAPLFPSFYAVYKKNQFAVSFGFNPIGGGGSALFEDGLPSLEYDLAGLVPMLSGQLAPLDQAIQSVLGTDPGFRNITGYDVDLNFDGSSIIYGYQLGFSYKPIDEISLFVGGRYVAISNGYSGYLKNYMIDAPAAYGGKQTPGNYLRLIAGNIQPLDPNTAAQLNGTAAVLDAATSDKELDVSQSGSAILPIIGINLQLAHNLNFGIKYEFKANIDVVNDTEVDGVGLYPDKAETPSDIPAMLSVGIGWSPINKLTLSGGFHQYFDRNVSYGKKLNGDFVMNSEVMSSDFKEAAFGVEFALTERLLLSAGYLKTITEVRENYQSDISHSLSTDSFGGGLRFGFNDNIGLNLGAMRTWYTEDSRSFGAFKEIYNRKAMVLAIGIDVSL